VAADVSQKNKHTDSHRSSQWRSKDVIGQRHERELRLRAAIAYREVAQAMQACEGSTQHSCGQAGFQLSDEYSKHTARSAATGEVDGVKQQHLAAFHPVNKMTNRLLTSSRTSCGLD
jgi:hypothetical protein